MAIVGRVIPETHNVILKTKLGKKNMTQVSRRLQNLGKLKFEEGCKLFIKKTEQTLASQTQKLKYNNGCGSAAACDSYGCGFGPGDSVF